ncbi:hypothetical protein ATANTOWER_011491 [Ataeniobius toweri]|uniref:Immunoglobulin I-set domain-containing protein n=1 Tax=Ataeniobius toweri TaxID=208326 RepID=A0ABU7ANM5_9TELE|nr:hypothetical protein [Ataeniobius toweri]
MKDGDFSVVLQNVSTNDAGTYEYLIKTRNPGGHSEQRHVINLTVSGDEHPEGEHEQEHPHVRRNRRRGQSCPLCWACPFLLFYGLFFINVYVMNRRRPAEGRRG